MKVTIPQAALPAEIRAQYPQGITLELPVKTFGLMGPPGTGKSRFIASMPKPLKVIATDPIGKMEAYFAYGSVESGRGPTGAPVRRIMDYKDPTKLLIEIEGFYDEDPLMPNAMNQLMECAQRTQREAKEGKWASVALDSYSGTEDIAKFRRAVGAFSVSATQGNNDGRAVYAAAKDDALQVLLMRLITLENYGVFVGVTLHTTEKMEESEGRMLYNIKAIGDAPSTLGRVITERYRTEACADAVTRQMVTRPDGRFKLTTTIDAPSPCKNDFGAIWANWINTEVSKRAAAIPPPTAAVSATAEAAKG